jgi:hypothetical protein
VEKEITTMSRRKIGATGAHLYLFVQIKARFYQGMELGGTLLWPLRRGMCVCTARLLAATGGGG